MLPLEADYLLFDEIFINFTINITSFETDALIMYVLSNAFSETCVRQRRRRILTLLHL